VIQSKITSLAPGDDLWVADLDLASAVTQKLDFYLNYKLSSFLFLDEPQFSEAQLSVLEKINISPYISQNENAPFLVKSDDALCAKWVLFISFQSPNWQESLLKTWSGLQKPKTRIFVPPFLEWKNILQAWPEQPLPQLFQDII
jgi:hypothetical protein